MSVLSFSETKKKTLPYFWLQSLRRHESNLDMLSGLVVIDSSNEGEGIKLAAANSLSLSLLFTHSQKMQNSDTN